MRFSLKMMLLLFAYVAVMAASIVAQSWALVSLSWAFTFVAVAYAAIVVVVGRGKSQAAAMGFVLLSVAYLVGLAVVPQRMPITILLSAFDYSLVSNGNFYQVLPQGAHPVPSLNIVPPAANSALTLVAGLLGSAVGAAAYRRHGCNDHE